MVESSTISISVWERVMKRTFDIIVSFFGIIIISPLLLMIAIMIKIEDPDGPVIFRNRRVGIQGKEFFLYKFRYMYWRYCVKDAYGVDARHDNGLQFEEELKKSADTRE